MKNRVYIKELTAGSQTVVVGWVHEIRHLGKVSFVVLRDNTGLLQCVVEEGSEVFLIVEQLTRESVVKVQGELVETTQTESGVEMQLQGVEVLSAAAPEMPIPVGSKAHTEAEQAQRLDYRWLDLRAPQRRLAFEAWTTFEQALRTYWTGNGFLEIHSPKLMSSPSESGSEVFEVEYFDRKAYLAQSPQFFKQMAMAAGFEKVFEVGPVFRAEPSHTVRHATEFTGYDMEMSFIEDHHEVMDEVERFITEGVRVVARKHGSEISELWGEEVVVPNAAFPRVTMAEAKELLQAEGVPSEKDGDLSPEEERELCRIIKERDGIEFVFVTDYPTSVRPFYHMRQEDAPTLTKSFDLLYKGVEIATGAQREHRYDVLCAQAEEVGARTESLESYLNFFKYACPPHGGVGIGPSRIMMKLLGAADIREVTYLHRAVNRLNP